MEVDKSFVKSRMEDITTQQRYLTRFVNQVVREACGELDSLMSTIRTRIKDINNPITDMELEHFILNLPALMYYAYECQEAIGIREDLAKQEKIQKYNNSYMSNDGNMQERKQQAELDIITDSLVLNIYVRARRQIQNKLDTSTEMLQSLKKIDTRRISENNFNNLTNLPYKED